MTKPPRRVSRRRHWRRRYREQKTPVGRLTVAADYLRAMASAGLRTIPHIAETITEDAAKTVFDKADALAKQIPDTELEKEDNPRWRNRKRSPRVTR